MRPLQDKLETFTIFSFPKNDKAKINHGTKTMSLLIHRKHFCKHRPTENTAKKQTNGYGQTNKHNLKEG